MATTTPQQKIPRRRFDDQEIRWLAWHAVEREHLPLTARAAWRKKASCRGLTDCFYPERGDLTMPAKLVCHTCIVQRMCLVEALMLDERHGIWGGLSEDERREIRPRFKKMVAELRKQQRQVSSTESSVRGA